MTQVTHPRHARRPREDDTAYLDPLEAEEAYRRSPDYADDLNQWAIDLIETEGAQWFLHHMDGKDADVQFSRSAIYATAVDDIFTGDRELS